MKIKFRNTRNREDLCTEMLKREQSLVKGVVIGIYSHNYTRFYFLF